MTAFLKIDRCMACQQDKPWEWVPVISLGGKPLAGTGVWRSPLINGRCNSCEAYHREQFRLQQRELALRNSLIQLLGGTRPYREFTFERFRVAPGNQLAFTRAKAFRPKSDNLYLWGACGVGKTHLSSAISRERRAEGFTVAIVTLAQLVRRSRMKDPEQEQAAIDYWSNVGVLIVEELGQSSDTAYSRQILQEILDRRAFQDRGGLIATSRCSLDSLAQRSGDDAIASRLAGMCLVTEIRGNDARLSRRSMTQ
jgi:DNA replication protein DnaC